MVIATLEVRLLVRHSRSLKDKRQVVRSVLDKIRAGFNVSAAEVEGHDDLKVAVLAFAVVAAESETARGIANTIAEALRKHPIANISRGDQGGFGGCVI